MLNRRQVLQWSAAAGAATLLPGCSGRPNFVVGSKNFQEQWILSALLVELIRTRGKKSAKSKELSGTLLCHKALLSGDIDCYVEYTGTALTAILKEPHLADPAAVYAKVRDIYKKKFNAIWMDPLGFQNTFALLIRKSVAAKHGLRKISDLKTVASELRPGFGFEFYERPDGYRGLTKAYGLSFKKPRQMKLGLTYKALLEGEVDLIAGNSTDGRIERHKLIVLEDDLHFFPPYQACVVMRADSMEKYPRVVKAINALNGHFDSTLIRKANYMVDAKERTPKQVASLLLTDVNFSSLLDA